MLLPKKQTWHLFEKASKFDRGRAQKANMTER
jgi:hypothetical protein